MKLSENFTLSEFIKSDTATRLGIDNRAEPKHVGNLMLLCKNVLEPIRAHFGKPIVPTSGYRSKALNQAVGGSQTSDHSKGCAVDFEIAGIDNYTVACWIRDNLKFRQLILEFYKPGEPNSGWVHVSFVEDDLKNEVLTTTDGKNYKKGLIK